MSSPQCVCIWAPALLVDSTLILQAYRVVSTQGLCPAKNRGNLQLLARIDWPWKVFNKADALRSTQTGHLWSKIGTAITVTSSCQANKANQEDRQDLLSRACKFHKPQLSAPSGNLAATSRWLMW